MNSVKDSKKYSAPSKSGNSSNALSEKNKAAKVASRSVRGHKETTLLQGEMLGSTSSRAACSRGSVSSTMPKTQRKRGQASAGSAPRAEFTFNLKELFLRKILNKLLKSMPDNVTCADKKCPDGFSNNEQKEFYAKNNKELVDSMVLFSGRATNMYKSACSGANRSVGSSMEAPEIDIGYVQYKHSKFMIELEGVKLTLKNIILCKERPKDISLLLRAQCTLKITGKVNANTPQDIASKGIPSLEELERQWRSDDEGGADGCNKADEKQEKPLVLVLRMKSHDIELKFDPEMKETEIVHGFLKEGLLSIKQAIKHLISLIKTMSSGGDSMQYAEGFLGRVAINIGCFSIDWLPLSPSKLCTTKASIEVFGSRVGYWNKPKEVDPNPSSQVKNSLIEQHVNIGAINVSIPGKLTELLYIEDGFDELLAIVAYDFLYYVKSVDEKVVNNVMPSFVASRILPTVNRLKEKLSCEKRVNIVMSIKEKAQEAIGRYNQCVKFFEVALMEPESTSLYFENMSVGVKVEEVISHQCKSETLSPSSVSDKKGANVQRSSSAKSIFRNVKSKLFKKNGEGRPSREKRKPERKPASKNKIEIRVNAQSASLTVNGNDTELASIANNASIHYRDNAVTLKVAGDNHERADDQHCDLLIEERVLVSSPEPSLSCMITSQSLNSVLPFVGKVKVSSESALHLVKDAQTDFSNMCKSSLLLKVESAKDTTTRPMHVVVAAGHSNVNATALDAESKCPIARRIPKYTKAFIEFPNNRVTETNESIDAKALAQLAMNGLESLKESANSIFDPVNNSVYLLWLNSVFQKQS